MRRRGCRGTRTRTRARTQFCGHASIDSAVQKVLPHVKQHRPHRPRGVDKDVAKVDRVQLVPLVLLILLAALATVGARNAVHCRWNASVGPIKGYPCTVRKYRGTPTRMQRQSKSVPWIAMRMYSSKLTPSGALEPMYRSKICGEGSAGDACLKN